MTVTISSTLNGFERGSIEGPDKMMTVLETPVGLVYGTYFPGSKPSVFERWALNLLGEARLHALFPGDTEPKWTGGAGETGLRLQRSYMTADGELKIKVLGVDNV